MKYIQIINNIVNLIGDESIGLNEQAKEMIKNNDNILILDANDFEQLPKENDYYYDGKFYTQEEWNKNNISKEIPIENLRESKLIEMSQECEKIIFNGITIETSQGEKHFSLTLADQINLKSMLDEIGNIENDNITNLDLKDGVPYHADGEFCRLWSIEDFLNIAKNAMNFVFYNQTYCNHLLEYIKIATKDELQEIYYGINLPLDIQLKFMDILNAVTKNE